MAVQQRRNSKTRKAKRRTHYKLSAPQLEKCANCGSWKLPHHACPNCGNVGPEAAGSTEKTTA
ncbi:MAG: 50S ribosomal protein L32 [Bulleidia sp.]